MQPNRKFILKKVRASLSDDWKYSHESLRPLSVNISDSCDNEGYYYYYQK